MIHEKGELLIAVEEYCNSHDVSELRHSEIARNIVQLKGWYNKNIDTIRRKVGKYLAKQTTHTATNNYKKPQKHFSAIGEDNTLMDIDTYCKHYGLPRADVKSYKLVSHTSIPYYNIAFFEQDIQTESERIQSIIDKLINRNIPKYNAKLKPKQLNNKAARLIYTDVHIGMQPNENGYSLYGGKWNEEQIEIRRIKMIDSFVSKCKKAGIKEIYLDDLGDFLDGWNAETVRKGHRLPQNMDNEKAFDVALRFKIDIVDDLISYNYFSKIVCNNIVEDNHSGSFGYVVNAAAKKILEANYGIEYNILRKFINHYSIGKNCFILSHGKDSKNLKFGFKPKIDEKGSEKISQYIKNNNLHYDYKYFEFSKGDSHQALFDQCTSDEFDYFNYPAFSVSSEWVQVNFKRGRSGYVMQIIDKETGEKDLIPRYFKWE